MSPTRIPVLLYHSVSDTVDPRFGEWAVSRALFSAHMDALAREGYRAITVRELAKTVFATDGQAPERTVVITFDDAFEDFYTAAWPELRDNGLTATVFVTTGCVGATSRWLDRQGEGDRRLMGWDQIAEVSAAGVECGAHGHTHVQLDAVRPARLHEEVVRSKEALSSLIGPVASFAYPHGYHSRRVRRAVREAGFSSGCAVADGLASASDDPYAMSRLVIRTATSVESLLERVGGRAATPGPRHLRRATWRSLRRAALAAEGSR